MTQAPHRRRFAPLVAATALLATMAVLVGCYHPHHYRHHRGGWDRYDHDGGRHDRHDGGRHDRHDRRGDRRGDRWGH